MKRFPLSYGFSRCVSIIVSWSFNLAKICCGPHYIFLFVLLYSGAFSQIMATDHGIYLKVISHSNLWASRLLCCIFMLRSNRFFYYMLSP